MKKILTLAVFTMMMALGARGAWADGPYPTAIGGPTGTVTPVDTTGEYEIYMAVDTLLTGQTSGSFTSPFSSNAQLDSYEVTGNTSVWTQVGSNGYTVIGLGAGDQNTLEVYTPTAVVPTSGQLISPFNESFSGTSPTAFEGNGTPGNPYPGVPGVYAANTQFGFALGQNGSTIFYSNPAFNSDNMDHMVVYQLSMLDDTTVSILDPNTGLETTETLTDPYLLAWEDTAENNSITGAPSDLDYNDLMVLVDGVTPNQGGGGAPVPEPATWALFGVGLVAVAGFTLRNRFAFLK